MTTHYPVHEDHADRTWQGEEKATDVQMNTVLEILLDRGRQYQKEIAEQLAIRMDIKLGTAAAATSGTLLWMRQAGWVQMVERDGNSPVWELVEGSELEQ